MLDVEIKRGPDLKKQSRLHSYVAVTLVLTTSSLMYYHEYQANRPACTIPLSAIISVSTVASPNNSVHHGIPIACYFNVFIGDRSFKFRVDRATTAALWIQTIMEAKECQIINIGHDNPLVITNIDGDKY